MMIEKARRLLQWRLLVLNIKQWDKVSRCYYKIRMSSKNQFHISADSTCIASQYSSPSTSRLVNAPLSFANIRTKQKQYKEPDQCARTPTAHGKSSKNLTSRKEIVNSPTSGHRKINHVMEAYQLENQSLKSTVGILKQQIQALNGSYKMLKQKNKKIKKEMEEKQKKILEKYENYESYRQKSMEYDELVPKIEELEVLQDKVIEENADLKKKQAKMRTAIASVLVFIGNNKNQTLSNIRNTLRQACSQS